MVPHSKDITVLRGLAKQVAEIAAKEIQDERRELWSRHNNLEPVRSPIYIRIGGWCDEIIGPLLQCEDPFYRAHEYYLRLMVCQDQIGDDYIIEPWITQRATSVLPSQGCWGLAHSVTHSGVEGGSFHVNPSLQELDDIEKLVMPVHRIDEETTAQDVAKLQDAVGDILTVNVDRAPHWRMWSGDISTDLGYLRGIEQVMWDIHDHPEWLHRLLAFMREGILKAQEEAEQAGDWQLANHENQSMPYAEALAAPKANSGPVKRVELWGYMAAQEFTLMSPEQHDEFMLQYQLPILEKFGLVAYGCCEDLTRKIDILRKIPNLRRIAVSPFADVAQCAEQIGPEYVCSWRPNPSSTVCMGFDEDHVRRVIADGLREFRLNNCFVDICLKDVHTVQGDLQRLCDFTRVVRDVLEG